MMMMKEVLIFGALNKEKLDVVEAKNYEMKLTNKYCMSISEDMKIFEEKMIGTWCTKRGRGGCF